MNITRLPTAYALGATTQQGEPVSDADKKALEAYHAPKQRTITDAMRAHYARLHQYSPRTRKQS